MTTQRAARNAKLPLPDALLVLAASIQEAADEEEALNRLTRGLADRGVSCALLVQSGDGAELRVERATLPLASDVWGRPLRLPRLAATLTRGRPAVQADIDEAFTERAADGSARQLLTDEVAGPMIVAPLRLASDRGAVLCVAGHELDERAALAAWALGLSVAAALRQAPEPAASLTEAGDDLSLFHELTRRLSYSLSGEEVIRAGLETLAPTLGFQIAAAVACRGNEDATMVYSGGELSGGTARTAAAGALDAFLRLTGGRHRSCVRPPLETVTLDIKARLAATDRLVSVLDAPLVTEGKVTGLLRIASAQEGAFDGVKERTFYTVANQISLALERVTAQREAERAHLASLADSLTDGIVLVDASLRVTSRNAAADELLASLSDAEVSEGAELSDPALAELARQALSSGAATSLRELPSNSTSSRRRYLMAMAAPLAGSPEGSAAVVILRDVTEERLMQERLLQSEKMVSVGQLVSGVAHELNNPLTGIMGFAQLLLARELDERTRRDVGTIHTEAERASKIVQNLLSFARRKRAEKELANLNVLLERVLELRIYDLRVKNIELELDLDPKLPETMVDTDQIQQVFLNVIINAEQAMLAGHGRGTLKVRSRREKDVVCLTFQDDGPGLDQETLRRIFDPFFTTKDTGEGTGLGLTLSYGIIDEHGGRIWAESQPGRGATFTIELPIVQGVGQPAGPEEAAPEPAITGRSILVVDDEESIQRLLGSILELDGHRVDTARNGREALKRIERQHYDMIITDIKMPDMDGRELYQRLLELDRDLAERTVFITGDTVSPDTRTFLEQVDNPCLAKPFRVRDVRETIDQILSAGT
ncbi:MAG: response regulator [Chloroflexi bacterium]|nr:response regulator [Chloroflexota bacterium]